MNLGSSGIFDKIKYYIVLFIVHNYYTIQQKHMLVQILIVNRKTTCLILPKLCSSTIIYILNFF